jgi:hypothetical protein
MTTGYSGYDSPPVGGIPGPPPDECANTLRIARGCIQLESGLLLDLPPGELIVTTTTMEAIFEYQKTSGK